MNPITRPGSTRIRTLLAAATALVVIAVTFHLVTTSSLYRFLTHWGEAESVAADVKRLSHSVQTLSDASIRAQLDSDEFAQLKSRRIDIELEPGELIWFRANDMYNVGLVKDGGIRYMRDGQR